MTKSNNEWVPEVGEICQAYFENHPCIDDGWNECEILKAQPNTDNPYAVLCDGTLAWVFQVKELKTEAEKRRELSIGELASDIGSLSHPHSDPWGSAKKLHDKGWFKPKPLTNSVTLELWRASDNGSRLYEFAKAIEAYIRGETP